MTTGNKKCPKHFEYSVKTINPPLYAAVCRVCGRVSANRDNQEDADAELRAGCPNKAPKDEPKNPGLPVSGYVPQSDRNVALVNENKQLEERVLRQIDKLKQTAGLDYNRLLKGRDLIELGFMLVNRAVFQPKRVELPEDDQAPIVFSDRECGELIERANGEFEIRVWAIESSWHALSKINIGSKVQFGQYSDVFTVEGWDFGWFSKFVDLKLSKDV